MSTQPKPWRSHQLRTTTALKKYREALDARPAREREAAAQLRIAMEAVEDARAVETRPAPPWSNGEERS